ncbi:MAG TPA: hypothetical protein VFB62_24180, partial [Polyangiaceae bacterium]|nr:hypothetical protein [Polyangiaceae bacterium]
MMRHLGLVVFVAGCAQAIGLSELDFDPDTCDAGQARACYGGPQGTENKGICLGGTQTCGDSGTWGPCEGEVVPEAENCLTPEDESCNDESDCTGNLLWQLSFGGPSTDDGIAVAADESGVVITGTTQGGIDFGEGPLASPGGVDNMFLAAFDDLGARRWAFVVCKSGSAVPHDLALTSDGRAIVAGFAAACEIDGGSLDGLFVASFDSQGVFVGGASLAPADGKLSLAVDESDRIVVGGVLEAADGGDVYVASLTRELSMTWSIT